MEARRRRVKSAMAFFLMSTLASSLGCNPFGWGVSQIQSLIHHHAHRPIIRDLDEPAAARAPGVEASARAEFGAA